MKDFPDRQHLFQIVVDGDRSADPLASPRVSPAAAPVARSFGLRLLGPVSAFVDGQRLALGGSKQRCVLAILALRAGTVVSADQLIEGLWGETPPETAPKMVQQYVSRLRKALRGRTSEPDIATHARGYELVIAPDALDVSCFERLLDQAAKAADADDRAAAVRAALQLRRGSALADVADEPFAAQ